MAGHPMRHRMTAVIQSILLLSVATWALKIGDRVAIIGAGSAGLTAAYLLEQKGFNVTVFEKEPRVGGKVYSPLIRGIPQEAGAVWEDSPFIISLASDLGIAAEADTLETLFQLESNQPYFTSNEVIDSFGLENLLGEFGNWVSLEEQYAESLAGRPSSNFDADPALFVPFSEFAKERGIVKLANLFRPVWIGWGYGYFDEVPALYVLRLMFRVFDSETLIPSLGGSISPIYWFPDGFQTIWTRLASNLSDVRIGTPVQQVRRSTNDSTTTKVQITSATDAESTHAEDFDALIIATDLKLALGYLDASEEENDLFTRIQHYTYVTHIVEASLQNISNTVVYFNQYSTPDTTGQVTCIYNRQRLPGIWVSFQTFGNETSANDAIVDQKLKEDFIAGGGDVSEVLMQAPWPNYFPHVSTADLQNGFYQKLGKLQGEKGTYYIGGIMAFETVKDVTNFAAELVDNITKAGE